MLKTFDSSIIQVFAIKLCGNYADISLNFSYFHRTQTICCCNDLKSIAIYKSFDITQFTVPSSRITHLIRAGHNVQRWWHMFAMYSKMILPFKTIFYIITFLSLNKYFFRITTAFFFRFSLFLASF